MNEDTEVREEQAERDVPEIRDSARQMPGSPDISAEAPAGLFEDDRASELRSQWSEIQSRFVDDPREAVKAADTLVDEVIRDLSSLFSSERSGLESQWGRDQKVSTEDLRMALRRYRSFFERLLSV
jgi:hypothetical protein